MRKPPYRHPDGSNCWTEKCRRGHHNPALLNRSNINTLEKYEQAVKDGVIVPNSTSEQKLPAHISQIATLEQFEQAVRDKRITGQKHPAYPYVIYKYSQQTTYTQDWDEITLASRGLVVNIKTGEIIVRPFQKFFNYSENQTPEEKW